MSVLDELLCPKCKHAADLHGINYGCMHERDGVCTCTLTWPSIEDRAIRRMTADLPINTESDPDAEERLRTVVAEQDAAAETYEVLGGQGLMVIARGLSKVDAERVHREFEDKCARAGLTNPPGRIQREGK